MGLENKMAICKHCKARITYLTSEATATTGCNLYEDGKLDFDGDLNEIAEINEWRCPECEEALFYGEDEARKFLSNKDELQELVAEKIEKIKKGSKDGDLPEV